MRRAASVRAHAESWLRGRAAQPVPTPRSSSYTDERGQNSYVDGLENVPERYRAAAVPLGFRNLPAPRRRRRTPRPGPPERHDAHQFTPGQRIMVDVKINGGVTLAAAARHRRRPHDDQPARADRRPGSRSPSPSPPARSPASPAPTRSVTSWSTPWRSARPGSARCRSAPTSWRAPDTGDGLLGRDFLDQFKMNVDAAKGEVTLAPK